MPIYFLFIDVNDRTHTLQTKDYKRNKKKHGNKWLVKVVVNAVKFKISNKPREKLVNVDQTIIINPLVFNIDIEAISSNLTVLASIYQILRGICLKELQDKF